MDPTLVELAMVGGGAVAGAMGKDAWESTKSAVARLFQRRGRDDLVDALDEIERRDDSVDSSSAEDQAGPSSSTIRRWTDLFADLLDSNPESADELRELIRSLEAFNSSDSTTPTVQRVTANRDAYVSGRDQTITVNNRDQPE